MNVSNKKERRPKGRRSRRRGQAAEIFHGADDQRDGAQNIILGNGIGEGETDGGAGAAGGVAHGPEDIAAIRLPAGAGGAGGSVHTLSRQGHDKGLRFHAKEREVGVAGEPESHVTGGIGAVDIGIRDKPKQIGNEQIPATGDPLHV